MITNKIKVGAAAAVLCLAIALPGRCDDISQSGRQIASKWQDSIITVQVVTKTTTSYGDEGSDKSEGKNEATGIVIDPSGLVVMSLAAMNPDEALAQMMPKGMKVTSQITDVKLIQSNGKEIPAKVILRDKDLDLAFLRPKQKQATPFAAIDLSKSVKPELLDPIAVMYRMGTLGSRSISASIDRIQSIVEKPRTMYVPGINALGTSLGAPVFAMDGNIAGILVLRMQKSSSGGSSFGGIGSSRVMYVILPAADVLEAAGQTSDSTK